MGWRTVIIRNEAKLSLRLNHLIVKSEQLTQIPIDDISMLLIENQACLITGPLLNALSEAKVSVVLCNEEHQPTTIINSLYGHHRQSKKIIEQSQWGDKEKQYLWQLIIQQKIKMQQAVLNVYGKTEILNQYSATVELDDKTNREGHAAKVYFRSLFGTNFIRGNEDVNNYALNFGYGIILSMFTRIIVSKGYLTELGIHHCNEYNQYNLACDFMEVFRPVVDYRVKLLSQTHVRFDEIYREELANITNIQIKIRGKVQYISNAIEQYVDSLFHYLQTGDEEELAFPILEMSE
ncbi:MAG: type II CRISPR-associated endonuclease Cas1 [Culicoidibacterales bacterium]